ncbi:MAG: flagellar basal body-associated FliL family protein [Pseudomonadota bacterium]
MAKLLLPLLLAFIGAGAGIGAGIFMRPPPEDLEAAAEAGVQTNVEEQHAEGSGEYTIGTRPIPDRERPPLEERDFVRMNNQFVVPVLSDGKVQSLVVLSISLETGLEMRSTVFSREPKLRSALLQVMFDHANAGGFSENFTGAAKIESLRKRLWEAARPILGPELYDVLITDIARQDT